MSFLHIILSIKDSLQQQIHFNGNIFGNKCCRCNEDSLYNEHVFWVHSLESPHRGDSNEITHHTIISKIENPETSPISSWPDDDPVELPMSRTNVHGLKMFEPLKSNGMFLLLSCTDDYLELFDGNNTNDDSLGKFCGTNFGSISSTGRYLTLEFVTDSRTQYRGFKLFYNFTDHVIRKLVYCVIILALSAL